MKRIIAAVIAAIILAGAAMGFWLYKGPVTEKKQHVFETLHLPIAMAGDRLVSMNNFSDRYAVASSIYVKSGQPLPNDLKQQVLDKTISEETAAYLAKTHGISISNQELNEEFDAFAQEATNGNPGTFPELLQTQYGVSTDDFKQKILMSQLLQTKLAVWHNSQQDLNKEAFDRMDKVKAGLSAGQTFDALVQDYSQDETTKPFSGDLGMVRISEILPELRTSLTGQQAGSIIYPASRYGLHAIKVLEADSSGDQAHLQALFVPENSYEDWYKDQAESIMVRKFIHI